MKTYTVKITGQFEFETDVDAESREEAEAFAEEDLDITMLDVKTTIINNLRIVAEKPA